MFTIDYDGRQVTAQKSTDVPEALQPELLLNDLQLTPSGRDRPWSKRWQTRAGRWQSRTRARAA